MRIHATAPSSVLVERADARAAAGTCVSDAGADIVPRQIVEGDPLEGRWERSRLSLRTVVALDLQVAAVESFIDGE